MDRKASIELSADALVIIVLAVVFMLVFMAVMVKILGPWAAHMVCKHIHICF